MDYFHETRKQTALTAMVPALQQVHGLEDFIEARYSTYMFQESIEMIFADGYTVYYTGMAMQPVMSTLRSAMAKLADVAERRRTENG